MYVHMLQHQQVSKNAQKLSEQLVEVIRAAKKSNENLSYVDVCQATQLTSSKLRDELGGMSSRTRMIVILMGLTVAAITVAAIVFAMLAAS